MSTPPDPRPDVLRLRAVYDDQLRGEAEARGSTAWDTAGPLWRTRYGEHGQVTYRSLAGYAGERLDALIAETLEHYAAMPEVLRVEWKTREHDEPADLPQHLLAAGFAPEEVETVMLGDAAQVAAIDPALPPEVTVRRVDAAPDRLSWLEQAVEMQRSVFGRSHSLEDLVDRIDRAEGTSEFWLVEVGGTVVSAGRLEVVTGTECAGLWGGATVPEWRGRGLYRALVAARARSCVERGVRYLHSDCTAMSRPILERAGLVAVTRSTPYVWARPDREAA